MPQPRHNNSGTPAPADDAHSRATHHDTVLLSDVPDVAELVAEASAASVASARANAGAAADSVNAPLGPAPNLSANALAALGQRYDILGEAGHGSMGNVYKARDRETGETVALKLLKPEIASDQQMMDRFKNELLFARKITHKNVCRVHDFNRIGSVAYTTMEFVDGESLRSVLNRFGGLPLRKGIQLALQISSGLKEAHAQGIVHRDLKPENVMIDVHGNVKIMDFGIARSMEGAARLTGSMIGTPAYMAPEQVAGKAVDYRTDIYSLGLILYEMFTGVPAFQAEAPVAVALKQMREAPRPPHEVDPSMPVPLERAILKCLEKDPARRFQSIAELEAVLRSPAAMVSAAPGSAPASIPQPQLPHPTPMLTPLPPRSFAPEPPPRRTPFVVWLLLAAVMIVGGLAVAMNFGALGGVAQATSLLNTLKGADDTPAPPGPHLPAPPAFAFEKPAPASSDDSAATPAPAESQPAKSSTAKPVSAQPDLSVPDKPKPVAHAARGAEKKAEPRPSRASTSVSGARPHSAQPPAAQPAPKPPAEENATYLWVGRFDHEDRALDVARRLRDLGLKVDIVPRHNAQGNFYAVFTGPYGSDRVTSVIEWLATQGFHNVHQVSSTGAARDVR